MYEFLFLCLCFVQYRIGPVSLADWALIALDFLAIISGRAVYSTNRERRIGEVLIFVGAMISLMFNAFKPWFSIFEFVGSAGKLALYLVSLGLLPKFLKTKRINVTKILSFYIYFISVNAVFQLIVIHLFGRYNAILRILYGVVSDHEAMYRYHQLVRVRTFYNEPGFMAIHLALLFIIILFVKKDLPLKLHLAYLISVGLTVSLSALFITVGIYLIYYWNPCNRKKMINMLGGVFLIALSLIIIVIKVDFIRLRLSLLFSSNDRSAIIRTVGTFHYLLDTPWYGTGIGNNALYYQSLGWGDTYYYSEGGEAFNVLVVIALTMGYIGLIGILIYQYSFLKTNKKLFLSFILSDFGWGLVFSTPIWTFLLMYDLAVEERNSYFVSEGKGRSLKRLPRISFYPKFPRSP